jgi:hypothetical protein
VAQHQREQPDHPLYAGLIGEHGAEMREVDLGLTARRRLEAYLERGRRDRPNLAQQVGHRGVAAMIAHRDKLTVQPTAGQFGHHVEPLTQIPLERLQLRNLGWPRTIGRRLQPSRDHLAHRLAVQTRAPGDSRYASTLPVQIKDHHNLSQSDHQLAPLKETS